MRRLLIAFIVLSLCFISANADDPDSTMYRGEVSITLVDADSSGGVVEVSNGVKLTVNAAETGSGDLARPVDDFIILYIHGGASSEVTMKVTVDGEVNHGAVKTKFITEPDYPGYSRQIQETDSNGCLYFNYSGGGSYLIIWLNGASSGTTVTIHNIQYESETVSGTSFWASMAQ